MGPTRRIAEFVAGYRAADLPAPVLRETGRTVLNMLGCALGGAGHDAVAIADRALGPLSGPPQASVFGRGTRRDMVLAALLNCLSASVHAYDDTHPPTLVHPGAPVCAAAFAVAEQRVVSGVEFLAACALGIDIACRLSLAICAPPARANRSWIQTGVVGGVGAAMAAGRLLGLDATALAAAIGIAAAQASGLRAVQTSHMMGMMAANACAAGLRAALLAQAGFTGTDAAIEARFGFLDAFAELANPAAITDRLGAHFTGLDNTYKPYPCGVVINPVIDACLELAPQIPPGTRVAAMHITASSAAVQLADRPDPTSPAQAQLSLQHWAAVALLRGRAGLAEGCAAAIADSAVVGLRAVITVRADSAIGEDAARATVILDDGALRYASVLHAIGSTARPMSDAQLATKFFDQALQCLDESRRGGVYAACMSLPATPDAGSVARLAC